ncbi:MAG: class I SAM-dependent methyltransferase [Myxococcales bacterium]|jgi:predicted O-methyltransferase YrrM|nr:class I SAM-dependent methyltransferase [Myxococcales bacterium]MBL0195295.1 class I SAM-dependent methyltransferase [Myxococcales bacterium]HQY62880.1 class I SAM-dependent methyltransferase [Polyangiaceae bacterium]
MSKSPHKSLLPAEIAAYAAAMSRETEVQRALREETAKHPLARMQISADQGAFLGMLVRLLGATRCLEVGTFMGYSALAVALALPDHGRLVACDRSDEWTQVARRAWADAGVAHKVDLRLGPAEATLRALVDTARDGLDLVFVDADKSAYDTYYELSLSLLRPGGVVAFDNVLWSGAVTRPSSDADTEALRALNAKLFADARVDTSFLTLGDGLLLARKR